MFSLIITIFSIALVVALVAATLYYGNDISDKGRSEATVAQSLNELAQVKAALTSYHAQTGQHAPSLQALVPEYMSSVPDGWGVDLPSMTTIKFESTRVLQGGSAQDRLNICQTINERLGRTGEPPNCSDTSIVNSTFSGCCQVPEEVTP